jgi:uncharacterized protein (TIGR02118 family)
LPSAVHPRAKAVHKKEIPMIVVLGFYKRKPGMSYQEFSRYWREVHGHLVRNTPEISRYIRRYVQHHLEPSTIFLNVDPLGYDGFSELWLDSAEDLVEMRSQPIHKELFIADEYRFLDMSMTKIAVLDKQSYEIGSMPDIVEAAKAAG